jgi:uncharacterized protein
MGPSAANRSAQVRFGIALLNGRGVRQDAQSGETWLRRAGLAGDPVAAAMVGDLYSNQGSVPPNFCEAAQWFQRAAGAGHAGADLGPTPCRPCIGCALPIADDLVAAYELGICLAHGIGAARNDAEALLWFHRAIEVMPADRFCYARMLAAGRGITQDLPGARTCYLRAAAEGNGDAAVAAGEMLVNGRGGPPDRPAAMRLFAGAPAQGHKGR